MENIEKLNEILSSFKIKATCRAYNEHKNACFYDLELSPGTRVNDINKYSTELSLALKTFSKPRIKIISKDGIIRFEFLKCKSDKVPLLEIGRKYARPEGNLTCLLGETLEGDPVWMDITKNPHLIIAGCTGSGKSTLLHTIIANVLLYRNALLFLMDPKNIEFFKYDKNHMRQTRVSYSYDQCMDTLNFLEKEMNDRYLMMRDGVGNIDNYPYIVLIIDEFADLIIQDDDRLFYKKLLSLAQKCRAAKIYIILSTQRPSTNIVNGSIKANFPARLACKVSSHIDSKIILDSTGAENLVGYGDAILNSSEYNLQRFQSAYIDSDEICKYYK